MNLSMSRANIDGGIEELDAPNSSGNAIKESQGVLSKQEQQTVWFPRFEFRGRMVVWKWG